MLRVAENIENTVIKFFGYTSFLLLTVMVILVILQIIARNYLEISVPWTEELSRVLLVWMTFIGSVVLISEKSHVVVEILQGKFQGKPKKALILFCYTIVTLFLVIMIYYGIILVINNLDTYLTSMRSISRSWMYVSLPFNAAFMLLIWVRQFIEYVISDDSENDPIEGCLG